MDVDDAGEERVVRVASDDHVPDYDAPGVVGFVEVGRHVAGRVDLVDVGRERHPRRPHDSTSPATIPAA